MKTKKRWGRKGFALFLALLLALSPAAAFANSSDGTDESQPTTQTVETTKAMEPETNAEETQKPETKPEVAENKAPEKATEKAEKETKAASEPAEKETQKAPASKDTSEKAPVKEQTENKAEKEQVPQVVKTFLNAVQRLAGLGKMTEENAEQFNALGQAAMDAYEAVQDANLEDYEGVQEALTTLMQIADSATGGTETMAAKWHTVTLVPASTNSYASKITSAKVRVGQTVNGYEVTSVSGTTIKVKAWGDLYGDFFLPRAADLWNGAVKSDYVIWAGTGSNQKTEGGSAMLPQSDASAYYYFNTAGSVEGGSGSGSNYVWNFTLKYNANRGEEAPADQTWGTTNKYTKSHTFTIADKQPTRSGWTFLGWADSSSATSATYQPKGNCTVFQTASGYNGGSVTKTIYAVWKQEITKNYTYELTWDYNGGKVGNDGSRTKTEETNLDTHMFYEDASGYGSPRPTREGYTFDGWIYTGNGKFTVSNGFINMIGEAGKTVSGTLTAQWKQNTPTPTELLTVQKTFVGLDSIPEDFSLVWTETHGTTGTVATKTLNKSNGTIDGNTMTWKVPHFYNTGGGSHTATLSENCDVTGYTYTTAAGGTSWNVDGHTVTRKINDNISGSTLRLTNTYQTVTPETGSVSVEKTVVEKTGGYQEGDDVTWNIKVTNTGNTLMSGLSIKDTIAELTGSDVKVTGPNDVDPNNFALLQNGSVTFTAVLENVQAGSYTNTAVVEQEGKELDSDTAEAVVVKPTPDPTTKLKVTKTASVEKVQAGDFVDYTITVTNTGSNEAKDVTVTDVLDSNLTFVEASLNGNKIADIPADGVYTIGNLAAGSAAVLAIKAQVNEGVAAGTQIANTAIAGSSNLEDEPPQDTVTVEVVNPDDPQPEYPQLGITKTAEPNEVKAGEDVVYTITVTNNGTVEAKGVTVRDTLPEGLTWKNAVLNDENTIDNSPTDGVYSIGDLGVGSSATLTITATVDNSVQAGTAITNTATAAAANDNPDEDKPSASVDVTVSGPEEQPQEVTLTFIVVNGSWNDGTTTTITKPVSLTDGRYTIVNGDVPAVGEKPNDGYRAGSWDTVPNGATVTTDTTYTYTYVRIETDPTDETDPTTRPTDPANPTNPSQPTDPTNPTDPTTPSQPTDPTNPTDPTTPSEPTNPTEPTDPATPTDPTAPQDPTEPTTPVTPVGPTTPTDPGTPSGPNTPNTPADPNGPAGTTGGTATVANVPTVTPAAIPAVAALAPAAAPAAPAAAATVADDAVPLAAEPEGVTTLADDGVPLAKGPDGAWALLNFALMNLAIFECLMLLIGYFIKTKGAAEEEEEENKKLKKKGVMRIISLPIAAISLVAFCLTEDITLPTAIVDRYTLLMAIIALVQTVAVVLSRKELKDETDDETEERAVA